jgi:hypothetical protein
VASVGRGGESMRVVTRSVALSAVVLLGSLVPVVVLSTGPASAKPTKNAVGSALWCKHHPHTTNPLCAAGTGTGSGTGGTGPAAMTVTVSPSGTADPLVETGMSEIRAVVQVETSPSLAGDLVNIDSSQLAAACGGAILFGSQQPGAIYSSSGVQLVLDADGNATVSLYGLDCAPGTSVIEADLTVAPFTSAIGSVIALPPSVTPAGVAGSPAGEVETGNSTASGDSFVYAVFIVETDPVYAEQPVEIDSPQLTDRCLLGSTWISNGGSFTGPIATATLDDDGNATFAFSGESCAAGPSAVIADILAGLHSTYVTTYTIAAPAPTI